jgi:hypothetical protein
MTIFGRGKPVMRNFQDGERIRIFSIARGAARNRHLL